MVKKKIIAIIALSCCFFESIGKNRTIDQILGKSVSSFVSKINFAEMDKFFYTTELSRVLLVGEPKVFMTLRRIPLLGQLFITAAPLFNNRLFDNRFEEFFNKGEKYYQSELEEAIQDTIVLTTYNTNAYSVSKLLDYLSKKLQTRIACAKDHHQSNENLVKYKNLLLFVQDLKEKLNTNGCIVFQLSNGNEVTINNDMFNTVQVSEKKL